MKAKRKGFLASIHIAAIVSANNNNPGNRCLSLSLSIALLAVAVDIGRLGAVQPRAFTGVQQVGIGIETLGHLVTNDINQSFEHSLEREKNIIFTRTKFFELTLSSICGLWGFIGIKWGAYFSKNLQKL